MPDRNPNHLTIRSRGLVFALVLILATAGSAIAQTAMETPSPSASPSAESTGAAPHKKAAGRRASSGKTTIAKPGQPAATPTVAPMATPKTKAGERPAPAKAQKAESKDTPFQSLRLSNDKGPVHIHADRMELDYKANIVWYRGHVHVTQGTATLTSDVLQVLTTDKMADLREAIATGHVHMSQGGRWATSNWAKLNQVNRTVEMTGTPVIHDGQDQVAGTRILIYLDTEKSVVDNAHAVVFPHHSEDSDAKTSKDDD